MTFKDHFSGHAANYASSRPHYPAALFEFLSNRCNGHQLAWDCATGNGQAAVGLAPYFQRVIGSDASAEQLQEAEPRPNIEYRLFEASEPDFEPASLDLVLVAQALHWFDTERFFAAVDRVLKPAGILAVVSYGLMQIDADTDRLVEELYADVLDDYWPPERRLIERCYEDIRFPFTELVNPEFTMETVWELDRLIDFLASWSAYRRYRSENSTDPLLNMRQSLLQTWGKGMEKTVTWPLTVIVRRK